MNDKDNELDIILNQFSGKKSSDSDALSNESLDEILGLSFGQKLTDNVSETDDEELSKSDELDESEISDDEVTEKHSYDDAVSSSEKIDEDNESVEEASSDNETETAGDENEDMSSVSEEAFTKSISLKDSGISVKPSKAEKTSKKKKKRKKSKINSSIFVALIVVSIVLTVSFAISVYGINLGMEYLGVGKKDVEITINIPAGSSSSDITQILIDNGIIENEKLFKLILKLKKKGGDLKPGDITLKPVMGYDAIIEELCEIRESYDQVEITFPEGISIYDAAMLLQENNVCSSEEFLYSFNSEFFDYEYESSVTTSSSKFYKFEGFFFPDTYMFYVDDSAYNVTKNMRAALEKKFIDNDLYSKIETSGFTIEEVMTLASIVQAEAATPEDMKLVASVFINRLHNSNEFPKLQSDATDNYYDRIIVPQNGDTTSLAMFEEAYNTYICNGLPAGPVGNPGLDAILAVVDAPNTNYFYFCSNLETRECFFAETLSEHEENLEKAGLV